MPLKMFPNRETRVENSFTPHTPLGRFSVAVYSCTSYVDYDHESDSWYEYTGFEKHSELVFNGDTGHHVHLVGDFYTELLHAAKKRHEHNLRCVQKAKGIK